MNETTENKFITAITIDEMSCLFSSNLRKTTNLRIETQSCRVKPKTYGSNKTKK